MGAGMIGVGNIDDAPPIARRCRDESLQQHVDARVVAQPIEDALHALRIEHDEDAAMTLRTGNRTELLQSAQDIVGDAPDRLPRRLAKSVEAAISQHVADRGGATQAARALDQDRARPAAGGGDRRSHAGAAAADDCNVVGFGPHASSPGCSASR